MTQPYTIRLTDAQVETLTQSGRLSMREGINHLLTISQPAPEPVLPPPAPASGGGGGGGHTITITVTID